MELETDFRVVRSHAGEACIVAVAGELDVATAPPLRAALAEAIQCGFTRLVVDVSRVTFIDSVGIGAILRAKPRLGDEGRMAIVVPANSYVELIFDVVGVNIAVPVHTTLACALADVLE